MGFRTERPSIYRKHSDLPLCRDSGFTGSFGFAVAGIFLAALAFVTTRKLLKRLLQRHEQAASWMKTGPVSETRFHR